MKVDMVGRFREFAGQRKRGAILRQVKNLTGWQRQGGRKIEDGPTFSWHYSSGKEAGKGTSTTSYNFLSLPVYP
jgi:hypothetical protein